MPDIFDKIEANNGDIFDSVDTKSAPKPMRSTLGTHAAVLESAANIATSAYGIPAAGLAGMAALPFGLDAASKVVEKVQKTLVYEPQTEAGRELLHGINYPAEKIGELGEKAGGALEESGHPMAGAATDVAIKAGPLLFSLGRSGARTVLKPQQKVVGTQYEKAVKPAASGFRTSAQAEKYGTKVNRAVNTIIENKDTLVLTDAYGEVVSSKVPQNLKQFTQAIDQTKRNIFERYNALAKEAGEQPYQPKLALTPIVDELDIVAKNPVVQDLNPGVARYAKDIADKFRNRKTYTVEQAQDAIATQNSKLEAFFKNPTYENSGIANVDALIVNHLRKNTDGIIESITGEKYQSLKNDYGALKAIERDVNRRTIVDARKSGKGFFDISDIFSGSQIVQGLIYKEPGMVAAGATMRGIKSYIKWVNDPNRIVKNMFKAAERQKTSRRMPVPVKGAYLTMQSQGDFD